MTIKKVATTDTEKMIERAVNVISLAKTDQEKKELEDITERWLHELESAIGLQNYYQ